MPYGKPPLREVTCHVCATGFPVRRLVEADDPETCPRCDAPIREVADRIARSALLAIVKTKASSKRIADVLQTCCRDDAAVAEQVEWLRQEYPPARARLEAARKDVKARLQRERTRHLARRRDTAVPAAPSLLAWARDLLDASDREGALEVLVQAWSAHRSSRIARVIEALADPAPKRIMRDAWHERARAQRAIDLDRLAVSLFTGPNPDPEHVDALHAWHDDPRLAVIFARILVGSKQWTSGSARRWPLMNREQGLARRLIELAVPSTVEMLEGYSNTDVRERIRAALRPDPVLAADDERALVEIERTFTFAPRRARAELFDAVYAAPDDDGPRAVLADVLIEEGDPRGEFIALQLSPSKRTPRSAARERQLLARNGAEWAGTIGAVCAEDSLVFERGFPAIVTFDDEAWYAPALSDERARQDAFAHPSWATIHTLKLLGSEPFATFERYAWARKLRVLHISGFQISGNLAGADLTQLDLQSLVIDGSPDDPTIDYLEGPGALPRLKALTVAPLTQFFFDRIPSTFQRLHTFACSPTSDDHRISSKNKLIQTIIERAASVPTLRELRFFDGDVDGPGWIYILRREDAIWHLELDLVVDRYGISNPDLEPFTNCADVTIVATAKLPPSVRRSIQLRT